jgi:hypothetical protein
MKVSTSCCDSNKFYLQHFSKIVSAGIEIIFRGNDFFMV